jgi:hypothetical protein
MTTSSLSLCFGIFITISDDDVVVLILFLITSCITEDYHGVVTFSLLLLLPVLSVVIC